MSTNNNENKQRRPIHFSIRRPRLLGFFKGWLFFGIILMLLEATIWPEISSKLPGLYQVGTLWAEAVSKLCELFFPYLKGGVDWFVEIVPKGIEFVKEAWPYIAMAGSGILKFYLNLMLSLLAIVGGIITLIIIAFIVIYFVDKHEAKKLIEQVKKEWKKFWEDFKDKKNSKAGTSEDENLNTDPTTAKAGEAAADGTQVESAIGTATGSAAAGEAE